MAAHALKRVYISDLNITHTQKVANMLALVQMVFDRLLMYLVCVSKTQVNETHTSYPPPHIVRLLYERVTGGSYSPTPAVSRRLPLPLLVISQWFVCLLLFYTTAIVFHLYHGGDI